MKNLFLVCVALFSAPLWAAQCHVEIKHEVHLDGKTLEIHRTDGDAAIIDQHNRLTIKGKPVSLSAEQQSALGEYRQRLNAYLPRVRQFTDDSIALADSVIDDIADNLQAPHAFDNVKAAVADYAAQMEARYYKNGKLIIPADTFKSWAQHWQTEAQKARQLFNSEFISSAFNTLKNKMSTSDGLDFSALSEQMTKLQADIKQRLQGHGKELDKRAQGLCDSLDQSASDEQNLLKKIPELKDYQVFSI